MTSDAVNQYAISCFDCSLNHTNSNGVLFANSARSFNNTSASLALHIIVVKAILACCKFQARVTTQFAILESAKVIPAPTRALPIDQRLSVVVFASFLT